MEQIKWTNNNNNGTVTTNSTPNPTSVGTATPSLAYGQYDLWGYVRLPYRASLQDNADKFAVHQAIANQLRDFDAPVRLKDVNVQRSADGGTVRGGRRLE